MMAGSVHVMARTMIRQVEFVKGRRQLIWKSRLTLSCLIRLFVSAREAVSWRLAVKLRRKAKKEEVSGYV